MQGVILSYKTNLPYYGDTSDYRVRFYVYQPATYSFGFL